MMLWAVAIGLGLACVGLCRWALTFKIDASPVGSVMIMVGFGLGLASIFMFGVATGAAWS